jgi:predicted dehydrogenase
VRLLILGGGSIGERHLRCFLKARRSLKVELCEPRAARRRELESRYPRLGATCASLDDADLEACDAAVVATPPDLHVPQARRLAAAGCHLLVEKPLCITEGGVAGLLAEVRKRGLTAAVGYTYRSYPQLVRMAGMIRRGRLGPPLAARVTMAYNYPLYRPDYGRNYFAAPDTGGGVVNDVAGHAIAYLTGVLGAVAEVSCSTGRLKIRGVSVEDTATIALRFATGALCEIWVSAWQPRRQTSIEIMGPRGQLRYRTLFDENRTELSFNPGDRRGRGFYGGGRPWKTLAGREFDPDEPFVAQARNFLAAIAGRGALSCSLDEALHVHAVCRAALVSARRGRRVVVR